MVQMIPESLRDVLPEPVALPDRRGHFGRFGGQFAPETLMPALMELEAAYAEDRRDPEFLAELLDLRKHYVGRPTPMYHAKALSAKLGGAQIWLKREDLAHTGAHKINNALGQGLLAKRMGKRRVIAETGAGQHGVATATVCAMLGIECAIYMGEVDIARQSLNVFRMKLLGAEVVPVSSGTRTLKDALNEAIRDWVTNVRDTYFLLGTVAGMHPYPMMVRDFQAIIGQEARAQLLAQTGKLPDAVLACVGGGSNAMGMFHSFVPDADVQLIGIEAAGMGMETGKHAASISAGRVGVLHGSRSYVMQDDDGQISDTHSISAGLDYPGVGPEHAWLAETGRAQYVGATDMEALDALQLLSRTEGIIPALESAHAIAYATKLAPTLPTDAIVAICLSGRGDKDMGTVAEYLGTTLG